MTALWNFIASNYGFLFCVWAFVGHIFWIKSGTIHFQYLHYPPKTFFIWLELCYMLLFWLTGPFTPLFRYYTWHPGSTSWASAIDYRYPRD